MSPYEVQILIACCVFQDPERHFPTKSGLRNETLVWMREQDLVDEDYRGTERAKAWLDVALNTPLPVQKWVIPERKK